MQKIAFSNQDIFVSVALATYNGERFLCQQLDSLLAQTYFNFEIVVSDDGSTDKTQEILNEYRLKDNRIKWVSNPKPNGFIKNFERAIGLCKGEIIFLCDQDDIWDKEKIASHVDMYQKDTSIKWVYNEVQIIDEKGVGVGYLTDAIKDYYSKERARLLNYVWGSCILGCATSYKAELLKNIWPANENAPAHDAWIQLAIYPSKSFYLQKVLQEYRRHGENVSVWGGLL